MSLQREPASEAFLMGVLKLCRTPCKHRRACRRSGHCTAAHSSLSAEHASQSQFRNSLLTNSATNGVSCIQCAEHLVHSSQTPPGMPPLGALPCGLAEQALQLQKTGMAPVNLAPFSIQRTMSGNQLKGANAAAERMQKAILNPIQQQPQACAFMQRATCCSVAHYQHFLDSIADADMGH